MRQPALWSLIAVVAVGAACSPRSRAEAPVVSPTGVVYERGTPPSPTRRSQTATLYLRQDRLERAIDLLVEGIRDDPENPIHYFLAGVTYARLGEYLNADGMFAQAEGIYPAYEIQTELEREAAWGQAFNEGLDAYNEGNVERALDVWRAAVTLYDLRPEAHRNLASLLSAERRYYEAISVYEDALDGLAKQSATRVLTAAESNTRELARVELEQNLAQLLLATERFAEAEPLLREQLGRDPDNVQLQIDLAAALGGQGRAAEADAVYTSVLSDEALGADHLYNIGVALFRSASYDRSAAAFERLTELVPSSRDAWFNYANSLFAAENWEELAAAGPRLLVLDPLGESSGLIAARAHLETGDREAALETLDAMDNAPVYLEGLQLQRVGAATNIVGRVSGNVAEVDSPVRLRFSFYDASGSLVGAKTLVVPAPGPDASHDLEVEFARPATGYRYELIS